MDHLKLIAMYYEGVISDYEFVHSFFRLVTAENVRLLLASTPPGLREQVVGRAAELDGVTALKTFSIVAVAHPQGYDKEAAARDEAAESEAFLRGAGVVRAYTKL